MEHQAYEELLTLQALDALDAADQRQLEQHLETCAACRTELAELRGVAGLLAHASTPAEPSAAVRARILDEVHKEKQQTISSTVVPFTARPAASAWANLLRLAAAIAFVAMLIGIVVLWRRDVSSRGEIARLSQQFKQQNEELARNQEALARQREAIAFMNAPGMKKMELAGTQAAQSARAMFVYDQETGRALIMTAGLPAAPAGMAYEVWFIPKGHAPMPGQTFTVDNAGHAMMMDQMPSEAMDGATIAITLEPKSGSASPTGAIYLSSAS